MKTRYRISFVGVAAVMLFGCATSQPEKVASVVSEEPRGRVRDTDMKWAMSICCYPAGPDRDAALKQAEEVNHVTVNCPPEPVQNPACAQ